MDKFAGKEPTLGGLKVTLIGHELPEMTVVATLP
jgi:hypothetical protein